MTDLRYADVTCADCGKSYVCTPDTDYYDATSATDGRCWDCLLKARRMKPQAEDDVPRVIVP